MKDIINKRFGRLTVIRKGKILRYPKLTVHYYVCKCNCGKNKEIKKYNLTKGLTRSCGCLRNELASKRWIKHGLSKSKVYRTWAGIKERCLNKRMVRNNKKLRIYMDIGISKEWLNFKNFYKDMGSPPTILHQIDRINPDGNYEKGNCRWVTQSENMLNQRKNRKLYQEYINSDKIVPYPMFRRRVREQGWNIKRALTTPRMVNQFSFNN